MSALEPAPSSVQTARDGGDAALLVLEENGNLVDHVLELLLKKMVQPGRSCAAGVLESTHGALDSLNSFVNPIGRVAHLLLHEDVGEPVVAGDVEEGVPAIDLGREPCTPRTSSSSAEKRARASRASASAWLASPGASA